jgi:hypothetical protein
MMSKAQELNIMSKAKVRDYRDTVHHFWGTRSRFSDAALPSLRKLQRACS